MCGRFEMGINPKEFLLELQSLFDVITIEKLDDKNAKYNIAPTQKVLTLIKSDNSFNLKLMNWGIKFSPSSPLIFNSRIETIKEKSFWFKLFSKNRCLVPMTGFYEWKKEGNKKQPYKINLKNEPLFFVPALFHQTKDDYYASLITTTPNNFIQPIHHRMPVIFRKEEALNYFTQNAEYNLAHCLPLNDTIPMLMQPVSI